MRTALERRHHENTATVTDPRRSFDIVLRVREFGIIAVLVVFVAVTYGIQHRFLSVSYTHLPATPSTAR